VNGGERRCPRARADMNAVIRGDDGSSTTHAADGSSEAASASRRLPRAGRRRSVPCGSEWCHEVSGLTPAAGVSPAV
jgi:hypothetical protein